MMCGFCVRMDGWVGRQWQLHMTRVDGCGGKGWLTCVWEGWGETCVRGGGGFCRLSPMPCCMS